MANFLFTPLNLFLIGLIIMVAILGAVGLRGTHRRP